MIRCIHFIYTYPNSSRYQVHFLSSHVIPFKCHWSCCCEEHSRPAAHMTKHSHIEAHMRSLLALSKSILTARSSHLQIRIDARIRSFARFLSPFSDLAFTSYPYLCRHQVLFLSSPCHPIGPVRNTYSDPTCSYDWLNLLHGPRSCLTSSCGTID